MKAIFLAAFSIVLILLALESAQASQVQCKDLVSELNLLRKAQNQIIFSLAENHDQMAKSLDDISGQLRFYNKPAPLRVINHINNTARAYHKRGDRAKEQAQSLDEATADLISRIAICLRK